MVCVTDVDGKIYPLGGNMRLRAIQELGMKEIPDTWVAMADDWTEEKRKEFTIKDNVGFGEWNWEELTNEWNSELLADWGVDVPLFNGEEDYFDIQEGEGSESEAKTTDDGYSTFELVMFHENKLKLLDTLNQIKTNLAFEKQEEALMELIRIYNKQ